MQLNKSIYRNSVFYFILFFMAALWAFWPNYFSHPLTNIKPHLHFHGITMTLWCLMLIAQGMLIRLKKYITHKVLGKISYGLALLILITGIHTAHITLSGSRVHNGAYYSNIALMFNSLLLFGILYGLAIYHRKRPLIHARYMICTILPMLTPITDRLIFINFRSTVTWYPTIEGRPMVWLFGFAIANLILLTLIIWDWKTNKWQSVFIKILGMNLLYDYSVITFYKFGFWRAIGDWIMGLPLS